MLERISHYRITGKLGEGGMGVVYAAEDERLGRAVALKMIRHEFLSQPLARERFWREARAAARVSHPNVCQIFEIGEQDGELFLVMERLEGESLAARLQRGPLAVPEAVRICLAVLSALDALHGLGLVHRDMKPSNVFLSPQWVKILDFGLSRPIEPESADSQGLTQTELTAPGVVLGTPHYMAPEQVQGKSSAEAADIFAVGVILFEMLSGKHPFSGKTMIDVFHSIMHERPPALSGSPQAAAVDRVIHRALAKDPEERYSSASEMAQELRAVLSHDEASAAPRVTAITRLIVLPFRILRPDPETDFLAFSLAEAIASTLSGLNSLVVRSTLVAATLAEKQADLRTIAAEADVDVVLAGTLLRAGDRIRASTQLVEAPGGTLLSTQNQEVPLRDVFQLQDDLVERIVNSLSLHLTSREHRLLKHAVPDSPAAYEFYLRANQYLYDWQSTDVARDLYLRCIEESPRFAPAWARLGRAYRLLAKWSGERDENTARAEAAFQRALEINPDLPMTHNLYANLEADLGRARPAMLRLLNRAGSSSNDPELFTGLVLVCRYCGLLDASLAAHEQVRRLDPMFVTSVYHTCFMKGDYARALETAARDIGYVDALVLILSGREREALSLLREREAAKLNQPPVIKWYVSSLRALLEGKKEKSIEIMERVLPSGFEDPDGYFYLARQFAYLGEHRRALDFLRRNLEHGYYGWHAMARDLWLDPLRASPEFNEILRESERRSREAEKDFLDAGGDRILGVPGTQRAC